jgi:hypothetical protein
MIVEALEPNPQLIESEGSEELKTLPADLDDALARLDSWMDKRFDRPRRTLQYSNARATEPP